MTRLAATKDGGPEHVPRRGQRSRLRPLLPPRALSLAPSCVYARVARQRREHPPTQTARPFGEDGCDFFFLPVRYGESNDGYLTCSPPADASRCDAAPFCKRPLVLAVVFGRRAAARWMGAIGGCVDLATTRSTLANGISWRAMTRAHHRASHLSTEAGHGAPYVRGHVTPIGTYASDDVRGSSPTLGQGRLTGRATCKEMSASSTAQSRPGGGGHDGEE